MKHLKKLNEEHVFRLKKPELLDYKVWNPISRGLRSEIIKEIKVAPNYDNIVVHLADGTDIFVKLKKSLKPLVIEKTVNMLIENTLDTLLIWRMQNCINF